MMGNVSKTMLFRNPFQYPTSIAAVVISENKAASFLCDVLEHVKTEAQT